MTTATIGFHRDFPLRDLHESPFNPRRVYDQAALERLAASIRVSGIITPLIARPNAKGVELAAGHRRLKAAALAGVDTGPVDIRAMTDAEFVEVLNIENLQRQDLTALEEADGYKLLMTKAGYTVERIAERIGMSVKYVYDRVKLLELTEPARQALRDDKITAGHAILLARLKPKEQELAMHEEKGGLWQHEYSLEDPDSKAPMRDRLKAKSVKELDAWIAEHVRFDAKAVDPMLFAETAATLTAATEQEEKVVKITHDWHIQDTARDAKERTITPRSWKRADGKHKSKTCEHSVTGVIVVGPARGDSFKVCIAKEKCKVHWADWQKEREQRAKAAAKPGASGQKDRHAEQDAKRRLEQAQQEAQRNRWKKAKPAILEAVAAAVKKAPTKATGLLAQIILEQIRDYDTPRTSAEYVPLGTSAEDLVRHAAFVILHGEAADDWSAPEDFPKRAKAFGIDVKKILDQEAPAVVRADKKAPAQGKKK